ncbi:putative methylase [Fervidicoccus fontis Kam940]|nr:HemK2/MTQ2 family protein methyltransferase [Fervidicoccus fontis]AFH43100.1 putative methylase [Fervidicoccus fontis Kam940]
MCRSNRKVRWGYFLCIPEGVYDPSDDTYMILEYLSSHPEIVKNKKVLDIGTGSGIIALHSLVLGASDVVATDVNCLASYSTCLNLSSFDKQQERFSVVIGNKVTFLRSRSGFDTIIINPPYLPIEPKNANDPFELQWAGGKEGIDFSLSILDEIPEILSSGGTLLLVSSSLGNLEILYRKMSEIDMKFGIVSSKSFFFEDLYLIKGEKNGY